jgi:hypothetical protein
MASTNYKDIGAFQKKADGTSPSAQTNYQDIGALQAQSVSSGSPATRLNNLLRLGVS